ncbi:MAG: hypothetical protein ABR497_11875 [Kiritimatiellia bacterium]|nr:hypothetical protein [Lentisphaerota bacterium]
MKTFLKTVLVLLLAVSGVSLWFALKLFPQREELKGRTQKLETAIRQIAATVEQSDENQDFVVVPEDQLKTFRQQPGGPPPMDQALEQLTMAARNQLSRLKENRNELAEARTALAQVDETIRPIREELDQARETLRERDASIVSLQADITERESSIRGLERAERELKEREENLKVAIDDLEIQKKNFKDQITMLEQKVSTLEASLHPGVDERAKLAHGQLGVVLYSNPEWNFVVLGFEKENMDSITVKSEVLVHRADQLVGKVRVESIVNNMAIAEILNDWQRLPPREGDHVML